METSTVVGIILIAYAVSVIVIALRKPERLWHIAKIQVFVKLLGERGATILFVLLGLIVLAIGYVLVT